MNNNNKNSGFTLIEVATAIMILAMICTMVLVVINNCMITVIDLETRKQAFELARENMENLLAKDSVGEMVEFGVDEFNPELEWELIVEPFYEPVDNRMWIQAVSTATYLDSNNEEQSVVLTHWLTELTDKQAKQIENQLEKEQDYLEMLNENDEHLLTQRAIREYLKEKGLDQKGYDSLLSRQKREITDWIRNNEYDPDKFNEFIERLREEELQWLSDNGFDPDDFELNAPRIIADLPVIKPGSDDGSPRPDKDPDDPGDPDNPIPNIDSFDFPPGFLDKFPKEFKPFLEAMSPEDKYRFYQSNQ